MNVNTLFENSPGVADAVSSMLSKLEYCKLQLYTEMPDFISIMGESPYINGGVEANDMLAKMQKKEKTTYFTPLPRVPDQAGKTLSSSDDRRLVDEKLDEYVRNEGVDMAVDLSTLTRTEAPPLTTPVHEITHSIIGVEEVDVDEFAVTQGESLEEPASTNEGMAENALLSLVEEQGTVREILEANGIIQGLTSPERPTEEKKDTPVADNGDKGEEEPGEL